MMAWPSRFEVHNNYYFLRQVSTKLAHALKGFTLVSCFSQSKDELVIEFNDSKSSFFIRASLLPELPCVTFPNKFQRARKNSVDLFDALIMKQVTGVDQFANERSFAINFQEDLSLIFKMHGNRSNVLCSSRDEVRDVFKRDVTNNDVVDRQIDWSREAFEKHITELDKLYFTFGKPVWLYLKSKGFDELDPDQKWNSIRETISILENPPTYFIIEYQNAIRLSLLNFGKIVAEFVDPIEAVNQFSSIHASNIQFQKRKESALGQLRQEIKGYRKYLNTSTTRLGEIQKEDTFKIWADNLMANLHNIGTGSKSIQVSNIYTGESIEIPLDERLSPQKNAERYYRKSKNQTIELTKLNEVISQFTSRLVAAEAKLHSIEMQTDHKLLSSMVDEARPDLPEKASVPFWQFEYKGFTIFAGKDAANNDELTMRWAHKNDLWLHARDVAGSHVIIKHKAGKSFPKDVIEYAASIAAWNSKRKTESLCPVIVTPKKFVRKRKGDPAGAVVVDREEVILVEPKQPATSQHSP